MKKHHSCRIGFQGFNTFIFGSPKKSQGSPRLLGILPRSAALFFFRGAGRRPREKLMKPGRSASSPDVGSFVNGY